MDLWPLFFENDDTNQPPQIADDYLIARVIFELAFKLQAIAVTESKTTPTNLQSKRKQTERTEKTLSTNAETELVESWKNHQEQNVGLPKNDKMTRERFAKSNGISKEQLKRILDKHRKTPRD